MRTSASLTTFWELPLLSWALWVPQQSCSASILCRSAARTSTSSGRCGRARGGRNVRRRATAAGPEGESASGQRPQWMAAA